MVKEYPRYVVPSITSIQDMLLRSAKVYGDKLALEDLADNPISRVSYKQLHDYVIRFGKSLFEIGIKERDHIAVISENRIQWSMTYFTSMCFNMVIIPIDKNLNHNEILNIIHESEAKAIVFSDGFEPLMKEKRDSLLNLKYYINMDSKEHKDGILSMTKMIEKQSASIEKLPFVNPDVMAEIIFTSGSLGRAKGVMLTQKNIASNLMAMTSMIQIIPEDRFLSVLPIHHKYECTCGLLCPLYAGASAHYARSLKTVVDDLQKVKATILLGVPLLYDKMFKKIYKGIQEDKLKSVIVPPLISLTNIFESFGWKSSKKLVFKELHHKFGGHIRLFIAGGAAPDPKVAKGLRELGFNFVQGYGLTETSPIVALNRLYSFKDNAAGLPLPGLDIKINNPNEAGIGEIYIKGSSVMLGYYKNQKLTDEAFDDGWFKTGDIGYFDEDGFLHINGRQKNVIISKSGENVFPEEIEDILNRNPFVQESMVYGEQDEKHTEIIAVQIVTDAEAFIEYSEKNKVKITPELVNDIIGEAVKETNKELPAFKQIRKFYVRDSEFEKTTTQKIKRYLVKHY
ncbi:MAG: long-chain fatty acid--CoA ligase [Ignavibacteriales bacterium]|nr:MAG: long-chain fatty acid--CoA ligase [Ignavibacteriales bacterium]